MPDGVRFDGPAIPVLTTDQPVLVFGGCYSNLQATRALLAEARRLDIPPERMICTGDVVAYGADPAATLAVVRGAGIVTVMGNCEESLAAEAGDCGCGFAPGSSCDRLSAAWFTYASQHVGADDRTWMAGLPRRVDLILGGRRLAVVHGAPSRINRFVFASMAEADLAAEIALTGTDGVIGGHCGVPFTRHVDGKLWHNSGAIGLPANDGTPRGWFSLLIPRPGGIDVRHMPLDYDHHGAAVAMRRAGLPPDYAETMETGIWPSFDVLPAMEQARTAQELAPRPVSWADPAGAGAAGAGDGFADPDLPALPRATVGLDALRTLWFNTGTLCNIACAGCYIESTPRNDRLIYLALADFERFLNEAAGRYPELAEIGFTGGEPFMNPDVPAMVGMALARGYRVLILTNAMRPMQRCAPALKRLHEVYGQRLSLRVSLDHFTREGHERVRGAGSFAPAMAGLQWLTARGMPVSVAARFDATEGEAAFRDGFATLFQTEAIGLDAADPQQLVLFPELSGAEASPVVSETCWQALRGRGRSVMCQSSRMVVHRKGDAAPSVVACTLLPYDPAFDLGATLTEADRPVTLDHPYCARFCVFGASSCSARG